LKHFQFKNALKDLTGLYHTCVASKFWLRFTHSTSSLPGAWTSMAETALYDFHQVTAAQYLTLDLTSTVHTWLYLYAVKFCN